MMNNLENGIHIYIQNYPEKRHLYITMEELQYWKEEPALAIEKIMSKYDEAILYWLNKLEMMPDE